MGRPRKIYHPQKLFSDTYEKKIDAKQFLLGILAEGAINRDNIYREAGNSGFTGIDIEDAFAELKIKTFIQGGVTRWKLPPN